MKKIIFIAASIMVVLLFSQCRFSSRSWKVYFWTSTEIAEGYDLYINGAHQGPLSYLRNAPECGDPLTTHNALYVKMRSGTYDIVLKDRQGQVRFRESITIKLSRGSKTISTSVFDKRGGSRNVNVDNCLVHEIFL